MTPRRLTPPARPLPLADSRLVALCRAVCATNPGLAAPFLAGYWTEEHIDRTAAAAAALAAEIGDIAPRDAAATSAGVALRLAQLLAEARLLRGGRNSVAEHLTGRAAERRDRLQAVGARRRLLGVAPGGDGQEA